ncbi:MAG: hypothetical protein O2820_25545, partial [Planctomycetota bacterium]|nr:hypothetical protein [Planctomycetota bacterium]
SSSVLRMIRRACWQRHKRNVEARYHTRDGFTNEDCAIETARFLLVDFAARSRKHSMMPIVLLFNDRGYADHLATDRASCADYDTGKPCRGTSASSGLKSGVCILLADVL